MRVRVRIEVPRGSFVKREGAAVEYVSPLPSPFNYGCIPDSVAPDGDPLDALVLGPRLGVGTDHDVDVHGVVRFIDAGKVDDKLICGAPPTAADLRRIRWFFRFYAVARHAMNLARGQRGTTRFVGIEGVPPPVAAGAS